MIFIIVMKLICKKQKAVKELSIADGTYYFPNVTPGKYLLRICTFYGAFKEFNIVKGNERLVIGCSSPDKITAK